MCTLLLYCRLSRVASSGCGKVIITIIYTYYVARAKPTYRVKIKFNKDPPKLFFSIIIKNLVFVTGERRDRTFSAYYRLQNPLRMVERDDDPHNLPLYNTAPYCRNSINYENDYDSFILGYVSDVMAMRPQQ